MRTVFRESESHGCDQSLRVALLCDDIGAREGADPAILLPAALIHDIARPAEAATGIPHEIEGARIAGDFLRGISYDEDRIAGILQALETGGDIRNARNHLRDKLLNLRERMYTESACTHTPPAAHR
ncbi:MAG: HD domain-containing protein [Methanomicrobiaceae archaeon]|nr:HD domain-containing protein [Methanomicrobiaceae archaeon]